MRTAAREGAVDGSVPADPWLLVTLPRPFAPGMAATMPRDGPQVKPDFAGDVNHSLGRVSGCRQLPRAGSMTMRTVAARLFSAVKCTVRGRVDVRVAVECRAGCFGLPT
jgi:hypothetical protein